MPDQGIQIVDAAPSGGVDLFYTPSESIFGAVAEAMVSIGWSIFPQASEGRFPGRVFHETIKWSEEHDLKNRLPTPEALKLWAAHCATLNVAAVFGPASGNTFAIDIDVMDDVMVEQIVALADDILGYTPLRREGRAPKIALIYRHSDEDAPRIPSLSRYFAEVSADGNATKSENGIEILGGGKLLTFYGKHHRTGRYFKWLDDTPLMVGPEAALLVTADQVQTFLEAVDARWRFHRGSSFATAASYSWDETSRMHVPKLKLSGGGCPWEEEDGIIVNGREQYLVHLVYRTVTGNLDELHAAKDRGTEAVNSFCVAAAESVAQTYEDTAARKWSDIRKESLSRVRRLVDKIASGRLQPVRPRTSEAQGLQFTAPITSHEDPELAFLPPNVPGARALLEGTVEPPPPDATPLDIDPDRSRIARTVQDGLTAAFDEFFAGVYGTEDENGPRARLDILKAPPGAGKTSRFIRYVASDPRTYRDHAIVDRATGKRTTGRAPIVMLLPTYENIDEIRRMAGNLNLDGTLPDEELRRAAREAGVLTGEEADARIEELRRDALDCVGISRAAGGDARGLVTMTYSGRIKAGCLVADKVGPAMEAGMGTSAFCKATVPEGRGKDRIYVEKTCPHYDACPAMAQRALISQAHVVFMPHSFLALTLPDEIGTVRAVVADERVHHLFLHMATFPAASLSIARREPRLTAKERKEGLTGHDMLADRGLAAAIACGALAAGTDPAKALLEYRVPGVRDAGGTGFRLADAAVRVCGNATQRDGTVSPETTVAEVLAMCALPAGKDVREEMEFWRIIRDRMQRLHDDAMRDEALAKAERKLAGHPADGDPEQRAMLAARVEKFRAMPRTAKGASDARIQYLTEDSVNGATTEIIRISWRTRPNWADTPTLLLDASAAPEIASKVWDVPLGRIRVHDVVRDVGLAQNVKIVGIVNQTFSNVSLAADPAAGPQERIEAGKRLAKVRSVLSSVAALFGDGRVVAGTSIKLRRVVNEGWTCPSNVDWCHFGAMRGLDMFKAHSAAVSIGRMEVPVRTIDGLVAALAFDDPEPEQPFDSRGDGRGSDDAPLRLPQGSQKLRMRSGHRVTMPVPMFPGRWARLIQKQYREEELLQFCGRLRPVYREGRTPVWFALSSVIPEELIVDDLVHIDDLLGRHVKDTRKVYVNGEVIDAFNDNARALRTQWSVSRLWNAARETGGVVDAELICAASTTGNFRSETGVQKAMEAAGFDLVTGAVAHRRGRGHAAFRWRPVGGGEPRHAFVRASLPDPGEALKQALRTHLGIEVEVKELSRPDRTYGRVRAPDKVDSAMGDVAARAARESSRMDRIGMLALSSDAKVETVGENMTFAIGPIGGNQGLPLEIVDAVVSLHDHWLAFGGIEDDRLMPTLGTVPAVLNEEDDYDGFESLGATVSDADDPMRLAA